MKAPRRERGTSGFTLLEIVIVLVIIALLAGFAVPHISGMMREAAMRAPVEELQDLAKITRLRAITEGRPYEILFTSAGFTGRPYRHYVSEEGESEEESEEPSMEETPDEEPQINKINDADEVNENEVTAPGDPDAAAATPTPAPEPLPEYRFAEGMTSRILYWGRSQWIDPLPEGSDPETGQGRWVFQPSGLCNPLTVQFRKGNAWIEVAFNPLTADVQDERHFFPE